MTLSLDRFRGLRQNLNLVCSVPVEAGGEFIVHDGHVYMGSRYGSNKTLHIIDVKQPERAELVSTMRFKRAIGSLAVHKATLYASEWKRALNQIDITTPGSPSYDDCALALGMNVYAFGFIGDYLVAGLNWEGIGLMDVSNPKKARWVDTQKLDEGFIEHLVIVGDRIFAAGASGGIRVFDIEEGRLVEVANPGGRAFNASRVFSVGDEIWFFGALEEHGQHLLVIDPSRPAEIKTSLLLEASSPDSLIHVGDGVAIGWNGYRCLVYAPKEERAQKLFSQYHRDDDKSYIELPANRAAISDEEVEALEEVQSSCMDDASHVVRVGEHILAAQGNALNIYAIHKDSLLAYR